jgi:RNA polymerase sigma-70 factor (ECF subfamily)
MREHDWLANRFEEHRGHLRAVAYRILGSLSEANDAVQEAWLRLSRADTSNVENLGGWLTTVVGRVCLDMQRSRTSRREEPLDADDPERTVSRIEREDGSDPEQEALLANSVGLALLVGLETLTPAERLAFVLHDMFAVPFDGIAPIMERSPAATRQLASRGGDFEALLAVLDPDVVLPGDRAGGARAAAMGGAWDAQPALVNGAFGVVNAPRGHMMVLDFTIKDGKIVAIDAITDPARLRQVELAVLTD